MIDARLHRINAKLQEQDQEVKETIAEARGLAMQLIACLNKLDKLEDFDKYAHSTQEGIIQKG